MSYTDFYTNRKEIKIPTLFSVFFVGLTIFFIAQFFFNTANFSKASRKELARMEIANVFPNQATVFWQTEDKRTGWIIYGTQKNQLNRIALDERDGEKSKKDYITHYMVLDNLRENSQYFFKLVVDNKLIEKDNGDPFSFTTISNKVEINNLKPTYGKVVNQKSQPIENAVVMLFMNDAYSLSTLSKNSGEWLIPLNYIVNKKTGQLKTIARTDTVRLQIVDENGSTSNITANLLNLSPLSETIVIGKNYDFLKKNNVLSATSYNNSQGSAIDITFPRENATIPAGSPLVKGKALPNSLVTIKVSEGTSTTSIQSNADANGGWQVTVPQKLSAGSHQIVLQTNDSNGNTLTKSRSFTIAKSGEQVLGEATDSATPTEEPTPEPTVAPTEEITPTTPVSGSNITAVGLSSAALVLLGLGLLILF